MNGRTLELLDLRRCDRRAGVGVDTGHACTNRATAMKAHDIRCHAHGGSSPRPAPLEPAGARPPETASSLTRGLRAPSETRMAMRRICVPADCPSEGTPGEGLSRGLDLASIFDRKRKPVRPTREEMIERGRRGGLASAEARRQRKLEAETAELNQAADAAAAAIPPRTSWPDVVRFAYEIGNAHMLGLPTTPEELAALMATGEADDARRDGTPVSSRNEDGSFRTRGEKSLIRPTTSPSPEEFERQRLATYARNRLELGLALATEEREALRLPPDPRARSLDDVEPLLGVPRPTDEDVRELEWLRDRRLEDIEI